MSATLQVKQLTQVPKLNADGDPIVSEKTGPVMEPGEVWHDVGPVADIDGHRCRVAVQSAAARRLMPDIQVEDDGPSAFIIQRGSIDSSAELRVEGEIKAAAVPTPGGRTQGAAPAADAAAAPAAPEPEADDEDGDDEEAAPYSEWSKAELVEECEARELAKSGSKADLIGRLEADDAAGDE